MINDVNFHIAIFLPDGELEIVSPYPADNLSKRWIDFWLSIIENNGSSFNCSLGNTLSHIRTTFTSSSGAALVTFYAHDHIVTSSVYLSSSVQFEERWLLSQFRESLINTNYFKDLSVNNTEAFSKIFALSERPIVMVVVWANPMVSDLDYELVSELELHLAGVFFSNSAA